MLLQSLIIGSLAVIVTILYVDHTYFTVPRNCACVSIRRGDAIHGDVMMGVPETFETKLVVNPEHRILFNEINTSETFSNTMNEIKSLFKWDDEQPKESNKNETDTSGNKKRKKRNNRFKFPKIMRIQELSTLQRAILASILILVFSILFFFNVFVRMMKRILSAINDHMFMILSSSLIGCGTYRIMSTALGYDHVVTFVSIASSLLMIYWFIYHKHALLGWFMNRGPIPPVDMKEVNKRNSENLDDDDIIYNDLSDDDLAKQIIHNKIRKDEAAEREEEDSESEEEDEEDDDDF